MRDTLHHSSRLLVPMIMLAFLIQPVMSPVAAGEGCNHSGCKGDHRAEFGKANPFKMADLPSGTLKNKLQGLSPKAQAKAMEWLHTFSFSEADAKESLRVDKNGGVYYVCPTASAEDTAALAKRALEATPSAAGPENAPVSIDAPPAYSSRPTASWHIYLDFNGGTVTNTAWYSGTYDVQVWSQDGDFTTFNDSEQTWMRRVYERVSEDYAPFNVNVTTDVAYDPDNTGGRNDVGWLLICTTTDKNGRSLPHAGSGGVAYVGVYGAGNYYDTYQPAWVTSTNGGGNESIVAEAASHEMGHNLSLSHDGTSSQAYYGGHGSGEISWGPIMGTGYNRNVSQWCQGEYFNYSNPSVGAAFYYQQTDDDLAAINNFLPYMADDHGNTNGSATALSPDAGGAFSETGLIERTSDPDVFSFVTGTGAISLNATTYRCDADTNGGNLDINLELYNSSGSLVTSNNPSTGVNASINTSVSAGTYYLHVKPSSAGSPTNNPPSGYTVYASLGRYTLSGTVISGDPSVTLSVDTATIAEAAGVATVTATLSGSHTSDVTVNLGFTGAATDGGVDYTASSASIVIPTGSTTGTATITAVQDTLDEVDEDVVVDIVSIANGNEDTPQQVTVTITDDDAEPNVTLNAAPTTISEASGTCTLTATLNTASGKNVTVDLAYSGTATGGGTDYTVSGTSITINAGSTSATAIVTAVQDTLDEPNETVIAEITSVTNGTENGTQEETITITDDDSAPTVTLSADTNSIVEASGVATVTATLSAASGQTVIIDLVYSGTAVGGGSDYNTSGSTITINPGGTSGSVTVTAVQDLIDEANETVIVDVDTIVNGIEGTPQQEIITIVDDDDPTVTISVDTNTIAEAAGVATVTATLSASSSQDVTVNLDLTGSATGGGVDYTASSASIFIPSGSTSATATITAVQDTLDEIDETVIVDFGTIVNGVEATPQQETITITDDDSEPNVTLAVDNATIAEAGGVATFTATLSTLSGKDVTVNLGFTGTAVGGGTDYTASASSIVISAGNISASETVTADQDAIDELDETVIVDILSVTNAIEAVAQQATTTITDDDAPPSVTLSTDVPSISEAGGVATLTATLSEVSGLDVTVDLAYTGTASGAGVDYNGGASITVSAGSTTGTATVTAVEDAIAEPNETVIVDVSTVTNGTESGTQQETVTITDNDSGPTVSLSVDLPVIAENSGVATVTATLSNTWTSDVTVNLAYSGTATGGGTDYTSSASSIVIPIGSTTGTVTVTAVSDTIDETDETVIVDITTVNNGNEDGFQQQTVTIADDDAAPTVTLSVDNSSIVEAGGVAVVTATLSNTSAQDVTIDLAYTGTATGAGTDYTASTASVVISAGASTGIATITAVDDAFYEGDETVIVDVDSVTNGTENGTQQLTVTITDDEVVPSVTLSASPTTIPEAAGSATITASIPSVAALDVTVNLVYSGTATGGGTDYTATGSTIVITAGNTSETVTVTAVQDVVYEGDETIIVDVDSVTNGVENGTQQETVTITEDDTAPLVTLSTGANLIAEAGGITAVTATIDAISGLDVTVQLGFTGTATPGGVDYTASAGSIVISAGSTTGTATITAVSDFVYEGDETVIVDVVSVTNALESGTQQETITIVEDDTAPLVTLTVDAASIPENGGVAIFTATLSSTSTLDVTVDLGFAGTAAGGGVDYTASDTQIIVPAGSTSGTITVTAVDDAVTEFSESVIVSVDAVTNAVESGDQEAQTAIIDDDGSNVTLSLDNTTISEAGGVATLTATLSALSVTDVSVTLTYTGTATGPGVGAGYDYAASNMIIIPSGSLSSSIAIAALDDVINEPDETVIIDIESVGNSQENGVQQLTLTIQDDGDPVPVYVTLSTSSNTISEDGGSATITATLSTASANPISVFLATSGSATGSGVDYTISTTQINIPIGSLSGTATVTAVDNAVEDTARVIVLDISSVTNGLEQAVQQVTIDITDDEGAGGGGGGGGGGGSSDSGSSGCAVGSGSIASLLPILLLALIVASLRRRRQETL